MTTQNTNDFVAFAVGQGANVEAPAQWATETVLALGFQNGIASATQVNTAIRQASSIASAVAQFMAQYGTSNVQDNGDVSTLVQQFITALSLFVSETLPTQILYSGTDAGTADAAVVTTTPQLSSASQWDTFLVKKVGTANDGPMTVEVGSTTASLLWQDGSQLVSGDWPANSTALIIFDGAAFRYMGAVGPTVFARAGQLPPPAAMLHQGSDSGTADAISVGTVSPPVTSVTPGMVFEITKGGATNATTTPTATIAGQEGPLVWSDGSALAPGDLPASSSLLLAWNGSSYRLLAPPGPSVFARISQFSATMTFFVNGATGSDSNNGLTAQTPFKTIQGAINAIQLRYGILNSATINVANGSYSGFGFGASGIASWNFIGNVASPSSVTISAATGAVNSGYGVSAAAPFTMAGFAFGSTLQGNILINNLGSGTVSSCSFSGPTTSTSAAIEVFSGTLGVYDACSYTGGNCAGFVKVANGAICQFGFLDAVTARSFSLAISGAPTWNTGFAIAISAGTAEWIAPEVSFSGAASGPRYNAQANGIINTGGAGASFLPGSAAGATSSGGEYL